VGAEECWVEWWVGFVGIVRRVGLMRGRCGVWVVVVLRRGWSWGVWGWYKDRKCGFLVVAGM
jgi:hypothetical protein